MRGLKFARTGLMIVLTFLLAFTSTVYADVMPWPSAGQNNSNTRFQPAENKLSSANVGSLGVKWQFATHGDVSATPAMDDTNLYFPDWAGYLYAVNRATGALVWSTNIGDYTGIPGNYSRTTPAIAGNSLVFGDQAGKLGVPANVMAVNKKTGALIWKTQVDSHPFSIVTQSAVVNGSDVYVGVASMEELLSAMIPNYTCCTFRGSILDLNVNTGQIVWKTYTVPAGYSGGAVWGSTPAVDTGRNSLYISTGNNYSIPADVQACLTANPTNPQACLAANNYFDAILSLNLTTGAVKWAMEALPLDAWNTNCLAQGAIPIPGFDPDPALCPSQSSPDWDFGQGPALFTVKPASGKAYDLVGAGQKSGQYWAVNADTGALAWVTQVGPGGLTGGSQWGSAVDGKRVYVAISNAFNLPWNLVQNGAASGVVTNGGLWSALDPATGKILWQTANPSGSGNWGAVSAANGVIYSCSGDGIYYALNGATGGILWNYNKIGRASCRERVSSPV